MEKELKTFGRNGPAVADRHPSLLMEDVLDDLGDEQAFGWLVARIDEDRQSNGRPLHVYKTNLFAIYIDYDAQTVFVSAELGCHPPDETFSLIDFYNTIRENLPRFEPDAGHDRRYGDHVFVHIYEKGR